MTDALVPIVPVGLLLIGLGVVVGMLAAAGFARIRHRSNRHSNRHNDQEDDDWD